MQESLISVISMAIARAVVVVLGGIALCTSILGAIGFALVAVYSLLVPSLGTTAAAFATSGIALGLPVLIMIGTVSAMRVWLLGELPDELPVFVSTKSKTSDGAFGRDRSCGRAADHSQAASRAPLSFGTSVRAYPGLRRTVLNGVDTALAQRHVTAN